MCFTSSPHNLQLLAMVLVLLTLTVLGCEPEQDGGSEDNTPTAPPAAQDEVATIPDEAQRAYDIAQAMNAADEWQKYLPIEALDNVEDGPREDITGFDPLPFGLPIEEVNTGNMETMAYAEGMLGYSKEDVFASPYGEFDAILMVSTLAAEVGTGEIEGVVITLDSSSLEGLFSTEPITPMDVAIDFRNILMARYGPGLVEEDYEGERQLRLRLIDEDGDMLLYEYGHGMGLGPYDLSFSYMSQALLKQRDSVLATQDDTPGTDG